MAGRIPVDAHRAAVAREMEDVFVQNLNYAADVLAKVRLFCLVSRWGDGWERKQKETKNNKTNYILYIYSYIYSI